MVFLRSFGILSVSWINSESVPDLKTQLSLPEVFKFYRNGKVLEDQDVFAHDDTIEIIAGDFFSWNWIFIDENQFHELNNNNI